MNFKVDKLITLLVVAGLLFLLNLVTGHSCAYSSEGLGVYRGGEKIEGFGSKRSKEGISCLVKAKETQE